MPRWIIKVGSRTLIAGGPALVRSWMRQVAVLRAQFGIDAVWVTSGAIATAVRLLGHRTTGLEFAEKQALCAIGQPAMMQLYEAALAAEGMRSAQVLVTAHDLENAELRQNLVTMLDTLRAWGAVPIVNENDVAMQRNRKFKDNDWLAAMLAGMLGAERLVLCTDVEGLYDADPRVSPQAKVVPFVADLTDAALAAIDGAAGSGVSAGGMRSKMGAAREAVEHGSQTFIVKGDDPDVLLRLAAGGSVGTRIAAKSCA